MTRSKSKQSNLANLCWQQIWHPIACFSYQHIAACGFTHQKLCDIRRTKSNARSFILQMKLPWSVAKDSFHSGHHLHWKEAPLKFFGHGLDCSDFINTIPKGMTFCGRRLTRWHRIFPQGPVPSAVSTGTWRCKNATVGCPPLWGSGSRQIVGTPAPKIAKVTAFWKIEKENPV